MSHPQLSPADPQDEGNLRRMLPAWMTSMVFHCLLIVILFLCIRSIPQGAVETPERTTGIVLKRVTPTGEYYEGEDLEREVAADSATTAASAAIAEPLPGEKESPFAASAFLPDPSAGAGPSAAAKPGGGRLSFDGVGDGEKNLDGGKVRTGVFGLTGEGYKFVYVFDKSDSMNGSDGNGRPLKAAKRELLKSLESLGKIHQFEIVFYNDRVQPFDPTGTGRLFFADEQNKRSAEKFIRGVEAINGTKHYPALKKAIDLKADNIFFLTDGTADGLSNEDLLKIRRRNGGRAAIHVIQFGNARTREGDWLKKLAQQNGGEYKFFEVD